MAVKPAGLDSIKYLKKPSGFWNLLQIPIQEVEKGGGGIDKIRLTLDE